MTPDRALLGRILDAPFHRLFRTAGRPVTAPLEISFALTYKCANRCRTCGSITKAAGPESAAEEYKEIFRRIPFSPLAVTFTGGEPFLREDLTEIAVAACESLRPAFVFIETCADLPELISGAAHTLADSFPDTCFVVKLPMDGVQERMDWMRGGARGAFELFLRSFRTLKAGGAGNLATVLSVLVSRFNQDSAAILLREAFMLYPDAVSLEFAGRMEALAAPETAAPDREKALALPSLYRKLARENTPSRGIPRLLTNLYLRRAAASAAALAGAGRRPRCFAGFSSLYIDPSGSVMDCPGAARELGLLKDNDYSLERLLDSDRAAEARRRIARSACACPMSRGPVLSNALLTPRGAISLAVSVLF